MRRGQLIASSPADGKIESHAAVLDAGNLPMELEMPLVGAGWREQEQEQG